MLGHHWQQWKGRKALKETTNNPPKNKSFLKHEEKTSSGICFSIICPLGNKMSFLNIQNIFSLIFCGPEKKNHLPILLENRVTIDGRNWNNPSLFQENKKVNLQLRLQYRTVWASTRL